jgi:hypothetical protein
MAGDFNQERLTETYKSLITLSVEGFRYLALINGGAVVILLSYLGNTAKNEIHGPNLAIPILLFLGGLASCGVAMLFAYLTQLRLLNELESGQLEGRHAFTLWAAVLGYVISLVCFCFGAWFAVSAFQRYA